ncbi:MAG: Rep protein [CRESS virus sp. ctczB4]|uniref:Replication-associated protein n=1 Tax=CRESS virus sp. ctczB4 TaxID=2656682 RepID=A0A5Q2W884_9VIRU|nr:MAG: Rep protein [CRESS virus sp. ctczB4]
MSNGQGIFWLLTIPHYGFTPYLPPGCSWIKGQLERGEGGFLHWQIIVAFQSRCRLRGVKQIFGSEAHCELSRSAAANEYVWKEQTRVEGTPFELGAKPIRRNSQTDWESVWTAAKSRDLEAIPAHTRVLCFRSILSIASYFDTAIAVERSVQVYWGRTGTGKSRRAWEAAGVDAYSKDPRSKFWFGYRGQERVVIDEFRGGIDVSHLLRWLDRYPVLVELKGSSVPLAAREIWITSNVDPRNWYPDLDEETRCALIRRLSITHFN